MTSKAQRLSGLAKELDALAAASSSTLVVYEYTATANQTVFTGVDNNGLTLNYIPGNTLVFYNEGMLQKTVDYATTSSSVITLALGAEVGALIRMYAFGTFAVANVYTKPESDTIITNLALKSASKADIVGTVSQSAGVPTGAIVESGSNANGSWTKWADGTMICRRQDVYAGAVITTASGSLFSASPAPSVNYPVVFVGVPVTHQNFTSSIDAIWGCQAGASTDSAWGTVYPFCYRSLGASTLTLDRVAIGRWF